MADLFGVLDLARAPDLFGQVDRLSPRGAACLYEGQIHPEVKRHCPWLVRLDPDDSLTRIWREQGWGKSWGLWLHSRAPLMAVRRRLRHFTQAKLPDGTGPVLFRFWDPRVFRVYFPLVEEPERSAWFKDIDAYVVEAEDGVGEQHYTA